MKEFILFIRNEGDPVVNLPQEKQREHVQKVGRFIRQKFEDGIMKAAQPLEMQGSIVSFQNGSFKTVALDETNEVISGYYQVSARDLNEAIEIAKADPRFEDGKWRIEVRSVMKVNGINE
jgi:hypothetical protein